MAYVSSSCDRLTICAHSCAACRISSRSPRRGSFGGVSVRTSSMNPRITAR